MNKTVVAFTLAIASLAALSACTIKHEERTEECTYNGQKIPCNQMPSGNSHAQNPPSEDTTIHDNCVAAASESLTIEQSERVCSHANSYSVECLRSASVVLSNEDIVAVCMNARSTSASCIRDANNNTASASEIVRRCR